MYYLIVNTYGEYPHIVDDIDKFYIGNEMLHAHSITKGNIDLWREAWDVIINGHVTTDLASACILKPVTKTLNDDKWLKEYYQNMEVETDVLSDF